MKKFVLVFGYRCRHPDSKDNVEIEELMKAFQEELEKTKKGMVCFRRSQLKQYQMVMMNLKQYMMAVMNFEQHQMDVMKLMIYQRLAVGINATDGWKQEENGHSAMMVVIYHLGMMVLMFVEYMVSRSETSRKKTCLKKRTSEKQQVQVIKIVNLIL